MTNRVRIIVAMGSVCALSNVGSADVDEPTDALLSNGIAAVAEAATGVTPASATSDSVDFEGPVGATNTDSDGFSDDGFDFIHGPDSCIFAHLHWGRLSVFPRNGTNILVPHGDAIMTASDGSLFSLDQVDLAGFFRREDPIHVIGTYSDNTTITTIFDLDGVIGARSQDLETLSFPAGFEGLVSARFLLNGTGCGNIQGGMGIDNIVLLPNSPPDCSTVAADPSRLWPPNHKFHDVSVVGVTDPDGDPVTITITGIAQDEPLEGLGDGNTCPDADGVGTDIAVLRSERSGTKETSGDGRVYHISFTAADGQGGECSETVTVCVPHHQRRGHVCVDQGPLFDSTVCGE